MVKAVLFDLDDTLFDHRHASRSSLELLHREHPGLAGTPFEPLHQEYRRLLEETHTKVLMGLLTLEAARAERFGRLFEGFGAPLILSEAEALAARYRDVYQDSRRPIPGALALLRALKPLITVGIVTNNLTEKQREKLLFCKMDDLIDFLVTSEEVGEPKPGRAIFEAALLRAGCGPEEAVMVGDSWPMDVQGARAAGIRPIWYNPDGLPCPEPGIAEELCSYEPVEAALKLLLGG